MKTQLTSIALSTAVAMFTATAHADSIHSVLSLQAQQVNNVQASDNLVSPKTTIQDYVDAARQQSDRVNTSRDRQNIVSPKTTIQDYVDAFRQRSVG